jgi:hypothetical protein
MKLRPNRDIGHYSPGWQLNSKLAGQVHMLDGNLPEWISGGPGRTVPMNKRTSVAVTIHAVMEPMIETTHRETVGKRVTPYWEGASAIRRAPRG